MSFDEVLVRHCSPALMGIKPANLVTIDFTSFPQSFSVLASLNTTLNKDGIFFTPLAVADNKLLLMVYNRILLSRCFAVPEHRRFLLDHKYPVQQGFAAIMAELAARFASAWSQTGEFPHEIGLFLGYPLGDVQGFIKNHGKNYKLSGIWKVYGDAEEARHLFKQYSECTKRCTEQFLQGISIGQLCKSAQSGR